MQLLCLSISHFHFRFQLQRTEQEEEVEEQEEGSSKAKWSKKEKCHLLNCINFCTLTATVYFIHTHTHTHTHMHACMCMCESENVLCLVVCCVLLSFIAFAWHSVQVKCLDRPRVTHLFFWLLPNAKRFLPLPFLSMPIWHLPFCFCCVSKINYHLVLFATYIHNTVRRRLWTWTQKCLLNLNY